MSRSVSYEDVRDAFIEVLKEGGNPSFEAVYTKIGRRGGNEVVRRLIQQVKLDLVTLQEKMASARIEGVPDELATVANELIRKTWETAVEGANQGVEATRSELEATRQELANQAAKWQATVEEAQQRVEITLAQLATLERELSERESRIAALSAERNQASERVAELYEQIAHFQRRVGELETLAEAERQRGEAALTEAATRHETALASLTREHQHLISEIRADHKQQIERASEEAEGARQHLMQQTDAIRQQLTRENEALRQAHQDAKMSAKELSQQVRTLERDKQALAIEVAQSTGRVKALEQVLEQALSKRAGTKEEGEPKR